MDDTDITPGLGSRRQRAVKRPMSPEDLALIEAARAGDLVAFQQLYGKFHNFVYALVLTRVPNREVEDIVQEVFECVHKKLFGVRNPHAFVGWLKKVTRSLVNRHLRKRANAPWDDLPTNLSKDIQEVADGHGVLAVMRELPCGYRTILMLKYIGGLRGVEIAERLDMTQGSVRVKLHRGRQLLRAKLAERGE